MVQLCCVGQFVWPLRNSVTGETVKNLTIYVVAQIAEQHIEGFYFQVPKQTNLNGSFKYFINVVIRLVL